MGRIRQVALVVLLFTGVLSGQTFEQVPGNLSQISVGYDGTVWGVNSVGQIYSWNAQASSWVQIPGSLKQIAVGSATAVWGVNAAGQVYRWSGSEWLAAWDLAPPPGILTGRFDTVEVAADGDAWAIDAANKPYRYDTQTHVWDQISGTRVSSLSAGNDGAVWAIGTQGDAERIDPTSLLFSGGQHALNQVSVGADGDAWGLNGTNVYHYNRLTRSWDLIIPGVLTQISVGSGANVWGLDASGVAYQWNPQTQTWTAFSAALTQISAAQNGAVWGLDRFGNIFEFSGPVQPTGTFHLIPGALRHIAVAADGNVWGINAGGQIYTFNPLTQSWTWIPGALAQVAIDSIGDIWGINSDKQIYHFNNTSQSWDWIPGELSQISVGAGEVWGTDDAQQIFWFDVLTQRFDLIPGALVDASVGEDGSIWGLNAQGQIYSYAIGTDLNNWTQIPGTLTRISAGGYNNLWGFNEQGSIYQYQPWLLLMCAPDNRCSVWNQAHASFHPANISAAYDGTVVAVDQSENVWRYDSQNNDFVQTGSGMSSVVVGGDAAIWALDAAGRIYQYW